MNNFYKFELIWIISDKSLQVKTNLEKKNMQLLPEIRIIIIFSFTVLTFKIQFASLDFKI